MLFFEDGDLVVVGGRIIHGQLCKNKKNSPLMRAVFYVAELILIVNHNRFG